MAKKHSIGIQAHEHLAEALKALKQLPKNEEGRISWESNQLDRLTFELIYSLSFKPSIEDHVKDGAIWHVLNECARANDFSPKSFLAQLRTYLETHLNRQSKTFIGMAQINARVSAGLPSRFSSPLGLIRINSSLSKQQSRIVAQLHEFEWSQLELHKDFLYMNCRVTAFDDRSALDAAYRKLNSA
jgi:hypothetical protein